MEKQQPLTTWFPDHIKPVHVGVYQTKYCNDVPGYSYWCGKGWHYTAETPENATHNGKYDIGAAQGKQWRGLAEQPK